MVRQEQLNQQVNVKQDVLVNPNPEQVLIVHEQVAQNRENQAAAAAAAIASANMQSMAQTEHYRVLEKERAVAAAREKKKCCRKLKS